MTEASRDPHEAPRRFGTGCPTIDEVLGGGFPARRTTQIYGEPGAGKTNIAATAAVRAADRGDIVALLSKDETTFDRVVTLAEALAGEDSEDLLTNIMMLSVDDFEEQDDAVTRVKELAEGCSLVIFDGIGGFYRLRRRNDDTIARRVERKFTRQITLLRSIARKHDTAVVVTNQVYYNPDDEDIAPLGGAGLQNWFDAVLRVDGFDNGKHTLLVEKHRTEEEGRRAWFKVTRAGLVPVTTEEKAGVSQSGRN